MYRSASPRSSATTSPEEQRQDLLAYAFRVLGARAVTAQELRLKLERRCLDPELVAQVLARVQELGYQDDAQVAHVENKRSGVGSLRVRQRLKQRGIAPGLIDETLQERDPEEEQQEAIRLLERRWPALLRKRQPQASAYAFLARRGFSGNVIWSAIGQVSQSSPPEEWEEAEADKD